MPTQKKCWPSGFIMFWTAAMMSPGRTSRLPRPGGAVVNAWHPVDLLLAVDCPVTASQNAALISRVRWLPVVDSGSSMRSKTVKAVQFFRALTICRAGNGRNDEHVEAAGRHALAAQVIDRDLGRFHVAAHADEDELGVFAAIRLDEAVLPARLLREQFKAFFQDPPRRGRSTSAGRSCPSCTSPGSAPRRTSSDWRCPSG